MAVTAPAVELDRPPDAVRDVLDDLHAGLDENVPARTPGNLLVATWNVRALGRVTPRFEAVKGDKPLRNYADIWAIAEVIKRFDVVAIQETREDLAALRAVMRCLGEHWTFVITDVNLGAVGNGERLAFVYDRGRVTTSGLAGELVVPPEGIGECSRRRLDAQFARSPYAVSFAVGSQAFTLVTLHVLYGKAEADREPELHAIGTWLKGRARKAKDAFDTNLIALGDFNIDEEHDDNFTALTEEGLRPPAELSQRPSTIFDSPGNTHFYDQIAWFQTAGRERLTLGYDGSAGYFDWTEYVCREVDDKTTKSWRISDHYPLWCEFELPDPESAAQLPGRRR